ncbi:hypothetical protein [Streptomyces spirodelae]|uniref:hypothetical protein n=1 Tax=Streptomyces spirodelae TaxID=2812904 RepID=UPI00355613A7
MELWLDTQLTSQALSSTDTSYAKLAAGVGIRTTVDYRYITEAIGLLAALRLLTSVESSDK